MYTGKSGMDIILLINLIVVGYTLGCSQDCDHMAGTDCSVTSGCNDTTAEIETEEYPGLPKDLAVVYIPHGTNTPGQNITWSADGSRISPNGFGVISRRMSDPQEENCVRYTINGQVTPENFFYYDCSHTTSQYHEIFSLPRKNHETDYVHRVVSVYSQNHDASNTIHWRPYLIEIYNDSCSTTVTVKFNTPPLEYEVTEIGVQLLDLSNDPLDLEILQLDSTITQLNATFVNVFDGDYKFWLHLNPNHPEGCHCKENGECVDCDAIPTSVFRMNTSHPKCYIASTEDPVTDDPNGSGERSAVNIGVAAIITTAVAVSVVIVVVGAVLIKRRKTKQSVRQSDDQRSEYGDNDSQFPPYNNQTVFPDHVDSVSKVVKYIEERKESNFGPDIESREPTVLDIKEEIKQKRSNGHVVHVTEPSQQPTSYVSGAQIDNIEDASKILDNEKIHTLPHNSVTSQSWITDKTSTVVDISVFSSSTKVSQFLDDKNNNTRNLSENITEKDENLEYSESAHMLNPVKHSKDSHGHQIQNPKPETTHGQRNNHIESKKDNSSIATESSINSDLPPDFVAHIPMGRQRHGSGSSSTST